jgi:hypothetical protein
MHRRVVPTPSREGKFRGNEALNRISVILSGLIDDPEVTTARGPYVRQCNVNLESLKMPAAAVFDLRLDSASQESVSLEKWETSCYIIAFNGTPRFHYLWQLHIDHP